MSYCRPGEHGSTIYAFRGAHWETSTGTEVFEDATLETFRDRLLGLQAEGEIIPGYVFDRIEAELRGETPMEYGMRALWDEIINP